MALSHVVSERLNVENRGGVFAVGGAQQVPVVIVIVKYRHFEIPFNGQSRSLKVVPFNRLGMVPY